jgi:hypothetical protein
VTALLDEFVDPWVDDLDGEGLGQLSQRSRCGAADAGCGAVGSGDLDAQALVKEDRGVEGRDVVGAPLVIRGACAQVGSLTVRGARAQVTSLVVSDAPARPPKYDQTVLAVANQALRISRPKRATAAEQENRLQERGLARAIATPDEVMAGMEMQLGVLDATEVVYGEVD